MIKAVVLDMDGTMFDTEEACIQNGMKIREKLGIPPNRELAMRTIGSSSGASEHLLREEMGDELYEIYAPLAHQAFREIHHNGAPAKPGLYELLEYLKEGQYKVAVATSTEREVAEPTLVIGKAIPYLDVVVYGDMIERGRGKPNPDIFLKACRLLGVAPEEAMGIEDSHNGIKALHAAGMYTVMIPDLLPCSPEIAPLVDKKLDSLLEVIPLLEDLNRT